MARLQKAIDLLSYTANPRWEQEWKDLVSDMRENTSEQTQLILEQLTAGLADASKAMTARDVELAKSAVDLPVWENLSEERRQLERLVSSSSLLTGSAGDGLRRTIEAMNRLESARNLRDSAEALKKVQEAVSAGATVLRERKSYMDNPTTREAIYRGVTSLGTIGSLFASATIKEAAAPVDITLKITEAGLLMKQANEENKQLAALSLRSFDRHQTQMELEKKMGELQEQRSRLKWAVEKAQ